jgi:uncharacterized protein (TIGR03437 family)
MAFRVRHLAAGTVCTIAGDPLLGDISNSITSHANTLAMDGAGNFYLSDRGYILKIEPGGTYQVVAGNQYKNIPIDIESIKGRGKEFAVDGAGNVYAWSQSVPATGVAGGTLVKLTPAGQVTTLVDAQGGMPWSVLLSMVADSAGSVYTSDSGGNVFKIVPGGSPAKVNSGALGYVPFLGGVLPAQLYDLTVDPLGTVYVDDGTSNLYRLTPDGHSTKLSSTNRGYLIACDRYSNVYLSGSDTPYEIVDESSVTRVNPAGEVATIASPNFGFNGESGLATQLYMSLPRGMVVNDDGSIYVVDAGNARIRKLTPHYDPFFQATDIWNAATLTAGLVAPDEAIVINGLNFTTDSDTADPSNLPTTLAGVSGTLTDASGQTFQLSLTSVTPTQVRAVMPPTLSSGHATIAITGPTGTSSGAIINVVQVAPALFSADGSGKGVASGFVALMAAEGSQSVEPIANCDSGPCVSVPIDTGAENDQTMLVLYGTGIRHRSSLRGVSVLIGGFQAQVLYAGVSDAGPGWDEVRVALKPLLIGAGEIDVNVTVDSRAANPVKVNFGQAGRLTSLVQPLGVRTDPAGNAWFTDGDSVWKVAPSNLLSLIAKKLQSPAGLAWDSQGNLYVAESQGGAIRQIEPDGSNTVYAAMSNTALQSPWGLAIDASDNLYVSDINGDRVVKVSPDGTITTIADATQVSSPAGMAFDGAGNLYIADSGNNRILRVAPDGTIGTVPAAGPQLNSPSDVAVDAQGNIYVADVGNRMVRKIAGGMMTTIAGNGNAGSGGDGDVATAASFTTISSLAVDKDGNLFVADSDSRKIREITTDGDIATIAGK